MNPVICYFETGAQLIYTWLCVAFGMVIMGSIAYRFFKRHRQNPSRQAALVALTVLGALFLSVIACGWALRNMPERTSPIIVLSQTAWHPQTELLAVAGNRLHIYNTETMQEILSSNLPQPTSVTGLGWSPNGNALIVALQGNPLQDGCQQYGQIRLINPVDGETIRSVDTGYTIPNMAALSPDGTQLATVDYGEVILWNAETLAQNIIIHHVPVADIAWSPDSAELALLSNNALFLYSAQDGTLLRTLRTGYAELSLVAWSPDGSALAVAGKDAIVVLDPASGDVSETNTNIRYASSVAWSHAGRLLATSTAERVYSWNVGADELVTELNVQWVDELVWSHDDLRLVVISNAHANSWLWTMSTDRLDEIPYPR